MRSWGYLGPGSARVPGLVGLRLDPGAPRGAGERHGVRRRGWPPEFEIGSTLVKQTDNGPKTCEYIGFGDIQGSKPYEFIGLGDINGPKPYEIIGFWRHPRPQTL